ncbi:MAG: hypothetical protein IJO76_07785 [Clostridia bacterium]|nr:hypothetical protein [Clostridia bacterium]
MFVHTVKGKTLHTIATGLAAIAVAALLLLYPAAASTGINRGLSVCTTVIIPTLYPFMLLAAWLSDSPLCRQAGRLSTAVTGRLFGLPGCCGPAILLSMVGGYPAGALATARLREQGLVTDKQVAQMTAFCVGGGPGFIISTVGAGLMGSTKAGILLYLSHIAVSLLIGIGLGRGQKSHATPVVSLLSSPRPPAQMVADTCAALLTMSGFVVLSATVLSLWEAVGLPHALHHLLGWQPAHSSALLAAVLEVSCGCIALAGTGSLAPLWLSLCLSWGGLSVQGQLAAALKPYPVLTPAFWKWRLLHGVGSGLLSLLLFRLFPVRLPTGATNTVPLPFSVSATASFMLLFLTFLAMLCFSEKKTGKTV